MSAIPPLVDNSLREVDRNARNTRICGHYTSRGRLKCPLYPLLWTFHFREVGRNVRNTRSSGQKKRS
jgi:hypothetical protein